MKRSTTLIALCLAVCALVACEDEATQAHSAAVTPASDAASEGACEFCVTPKEQQTQQKVADAHKPCEACLEAGVTSPEGCEACEIDAAAKVADAAAAAMNTSLTLATPTTQPAAEQTYKARSSPWLDAKDRDAPFDLDYHATDQDGKSLKLADMVGKPIVISFIFTRCSNPKMCPAITLQMANLQRDLEKADLSDDVHVVLMSYDPAYDTPRRLNKFGSDRGFRFTAGDMMLQPNVDEYRDLIGELAIAVAPLPDGTFNHAMELLVIDAQGRFVRDYQGDLWKNEAIVEDVTKLVAEMK